MVDQRVMPRSQWIDRGRAVVRRLVLGLALQVAAISVVGLAVSTAVAVPADTSAALAAEGAALFKRNEYLDAARTFDRAIALDGKDFRLLRYAGRAWQEVGHWPKALDLLERYDRQEPEVALRATLLPNLDKLRKATPQERAEALEGACQRYPQAGLEADAGKAFEVLNDAAGHRKALAFAETARRAATDPSQVAELDAWIARLRTRQAELDRPTAVQTPAPPVPVVRTSGGPTGAQWAAWGGGATLAVAGAVLWVMGASATQAANDDLTEGRSTYAEYKNARDGADVQYFTGVGLVGAGAVAAAVGWFLAPESADAAQTRLFVTPAPAGIGLAMRF